MGALLLIGSLPSAYLKVGGTMEELVLSGEAVLPEISTNLE